MLFGGRLFNKVTSKIQHDRLILKSFESLKYLTIMIALVCFIFFPNCRLYAFTQCESGESCCKDESSVEVVEIVYDCHGNQIVVEQTGCKCTGEEICRCDDNQSEDGSCNCPDPFEEMPNDHAILIKNPNSYNPRLDIYDDNLNSLFYPDVSNKETLDLIDNQTIPDDITTLALWLLQLF